MRVKPIELLHLAVGAPAEITVPGVSEISIGNRREAARRVKSRCEFVGDSLIVDKAVRVRGMDGLFVEVFRVERPAFDSRDLRGNQCGSVFKICGAMLGPYLDLLIVFDQGVQMPLLLFRRSRIPRGRVSQGGIKSEVACLDL